VVNAGPGQEFLSLDYRNSDRIIWDQKEVVGRLWQRVLQGQGIKEYFKELVPGRNYEEVLGSSFVQRGERWVPSKQGEVFLFFSCLWWNTVIWALIWSSLGIIGEKARNITEKEANGNQE